MNRLKIMSVAMLLIVSVAITPTIGRTVEAEGGGVASGATIAEMIRNAKTAEDHLKIAEYFDKQAQEAEQKARDSAAFARCYEATRKLGSKRATSARGECILEQRQYGKIAAEDRKLAKIHRELAAELEKEGKK